MLNFIAEKIFDKWCNLKFSKREIALDYILKFSGKWYIWGGKAPIDFDCSELACEYCRALGGIGRNDDFVAEQLSKMFPKIDTPQRGCLVFFKNQDGRIIHVEIMLNSELSIGASGGGSDVTTIEKAMEKDAFVKVRSIKGRENAIAGFRNPFIGGGFGAVG